MADNPRIDELRRRVQKDPASIAFAQLAEEFRRAGEYEEAARICRTGLARHPSYLSARVTLGRALIELGQFEDGRTELDYVLQSAPENLAAIRGLAEIHQRQGDLAGALRLYQNALAIAKHDPELEETVHDLSRQLGSPASASMPVEPPPIDDAAFTRPASVFETRPAAPSLASLSPELEAAADEFTKALAALDALRLDLPAPSLAEPATVASAPPPPLPPPLDQVDDVLEPEEQAAPAPALTADDAVVSELESWLDAIETDRDARSAKRS